tara:strand:- start:224 stop:445 length:222 start_codon:yes stop_codon:yes gene_type:complete
MALFCDMVQPSKIIRSNFSGMKDLSPQGELGVEQKIQSKAQPDAALVPQPARFFGRDHCAEFNCGTVPRFRSH